MDNIANLLGRSYLDPAIGQWLRSVKTSQEPTPDSVGYIIDQDLGIWMHFQEWGIFSWKYGTPRSRFQDNRDEWLLCSIGFSNYKNGKKKFSYPVPYNTQMGEAIEDFEKRTGLKPYQKNKKKEGGFYYIYLVDEIEFRLDLDSEKKVEWVNIDLPDYSRREELALKALIKAQKNNINDSNIAKIKNKATDLPTKKWKKRQAEGDELLTAENIDAVEKVLVEFLDQMIAAAESRKVQKVLSAVKKIVKQLNKLNDRGESFIETLEREELGEFINETARLTGFELGENDDLTAEWREW